MDEVKRSCRELKKIGPIVHMPKDDKGEDDDDEYDDEEDNADKRLAQGVPESRHVVYESEVLEDGDKRKEGTEGSGEQPVVLVVRKRFDVTMDAFCVDIKFLDT